MEKINFIVPAINCGHCVQTIKTELLDLEGVSEVTADAETKQVKVVYDNPATEASIKNLLKEINYPVQE
ncbi:MAG TPA: heavy-metal-associated domain-containing protein [Anaerolineaceae bacterium]|nr:heavy-metal-associated domain-containing protein [Anaerolineaceae bacterium]